MGPNVAKAAALAKLEWYRLFTVYPPSEDDKVPSGTQPSKQSLKAIDLDGQRQLARAVDRGHYWPAGAYVVTSNAYEGIAGCGQRSPIELAYNLS